jgi:transcriptional regulator with XRE-family HTH domain
VVVKSERRAADLIRRARRHREWTQAELARRVGMPASQLCAYESSAKQPSAATLDRILRAAGLELGALTPEMERHRQARELMDVLELVDAMPPRDLSRRPMMPPFRELIRE